MTRSFKTKGWNGYLDWEAQSAGAYDTNAPELWEPVFVRSVDALISTQDFFASVNAQADYAFDPFEEDYNARFRETGKPVEAILLRKHVGTRPSTGFEATIQVLHVGALSPKRDTTRTAPTFDIHANSVPAAIGIIDSGIGYLHPNFWDANQDTRFAGILRQSLPAHDTADEISSGEALTPAEINADIARLASASEDEIYSERNAELHGPLTRHEMRQLVTHGTAMLDLAAGMDPTGNDLKGMRNIPILAVSLPPEAFEDTSGVRMQIHVIQGLRWMIYRAFAENLCDELVVNISLGVVAGPKNGGSFLEQQMKREIERVTAHFNGVKTLELVFAFGNAHEDRLVARAALAGSQSNEVQLCLQPDDRTANYVELRLTDLSEQSKPKRIEVTLTAPDGSSQTQTVRKGRHKTLFGTEEAPIARLYNTPAREIWDGVDEPAHLTLAFAPTNAKNGPSAVSGRWTISCRNASAKTMDLTLQVQRDDSPFARNTGARQAYFEDAKVRGWNQHYRDYSALDTSSLVTHEGTNSAFSTVAHDNAHRIGAARVRLGESSPAEYTAQGADWSGGAPDASAISEAEWRSSGVSAAGTFAAANARLSGTSAAAATYTRHLVKPETTVPVVTDFDRLGTVTVIDNPSIRRQRR
ncbi:hypothetical protein [Planktotalea sp.]|uniref:hypothetical protein n=1 Tax=Planktotalea sp. TaxID=2029877 RepID=UPI003298E43E